jgi:hypothetical protein
MNRMVAFPPAGAEGGRTAAGWFRVAECGEAAHKGGLRGGCGGLFCIRLWCLLHCRGPPPPPPPQTGGGEWTRRGRGRANTPSLFWVWGGVVTAAVERAPKSNAKRIATACHPFSPNPLEERVPDRAGGGGTARCQGFSGKVAGCKSLQGANPPPQAGEGTASSGASSEINY